MDNEEILENEIMEENTEIIPDTAPDPVENLENMEESPVDVPDDIENGDTGEIENVSPDVVPGDTLPEEGGEDVGEIENDVTILPDNDVAQQEEDTSISENSTTSQVTDIGEGAASSTVSGNGAGYSYTANYYTLQEEQPQPFQWEKPLADFTTSEMLLFLIFLLLLVRFVHDIFKGSRWFKR